MNKQLFRIPILCIALTLCSLLGCGTPSNTPGNAPGQTEADLPAELQPPSPGGAESSPLETLEDIAYIITIQINPCFEIYVDVNDQIVSLQPLNEDAEQLCAAVDVIHKAPNDGLYALLSQARNDGFLENGDTVDILLEYVHFSDESKADHFHSLGERVRTILNLQQMPDALITMNLSSRIPSEPQDPQGENLGVSSPAGSEDPFLLESETSADGICIYEKRLTEDGGTMEYYYSSLGHLQTTIYRDIFGSVKTTQYNSEGLPSSSIFIRMDGAQIHQTYDDAWNVIHEVFYDVDGSVITREYYPNSVLKSEHTLMADGSTIECAWTEAGINTYTKEQYANGLEGYALCYESGQLKEAYTKEANGDIFLTKYDENGNEIYKNHTRDGKRYETIYNEDLSGTETIYHPDGTTEILYFNSTGKAYAGIDREGKSFTLLNNMPVYDEE